jgi:hypothetical protein
MVFCGHPDRRELSVNCAFFLYTLIERMRAEFYMSFHCGPSPRTGRGGLGGQWWAVAGRFCRPCSSRRGLMVTSCPASVYRSSKLRGSVSTGRREGGRCDPFSRSTTSVQNISYIFSNVRFQVLTATSMKLRIFWDVLPCS